MPISVQTAQRHVDFQTAIDKKQIVLDQPKSSTMYQLDYPQHSSVDPIVEYTNQWPASDWFFQ